MEASAVVAAYNWVSKFGVVLRCASGPWYGGRGEAASIDRDACDLSFMNAETMTSANVGILTGRALVRSRGREQ